MAGKSRLWTRACRAAGGVTSLEQNRGVDPRTWTEGIDNDQKRKADHWVSER
jgi:hypothetical protein